MKHGLRENSFACDYEGTNFAQNKYNSKFCEYILAGLIIENENRHAKMIDAY